LLSVSRPHRPARTPFARTVLASVLLVVLLAGVVPFSSLASSHPCAMACCVGKAAHLAGSCSTALDDEEEAESPADEQGEEEVTAAAHSDHMMHEPGATAPAREAAKHQESATQHSAHHSTPGEKSPRTSSVSSQAAMTTPCSTECAAAVSGYTQVRRPRDAASLAIAAHQHQPTNQFIFSHFSKPLTEAAARRKLSRPRAPPFPSR
jgi:hypothetical protein